MYAKMLGIIFFTLRAKMQKIEKCAKSIFEIQEVKNSIENSLGMKKKIISK